MRAKLSLVSVAVMIFLPATSAFGMKAIVPADDMQTIVNPDNALDRRIVLYFDLPEEMETTDIEIDFAMFNCRMKVENGSVGTIEVYPVTADWRLSGHVAWNSPWENPGGDYSTDNRSARYWLKSEDGSRDIQIDVTDIVRKWVSGVIANNGLLVKLSADDLAREQVRYEVSDVDVHLEVLYSTAPDAEIGR